MTTPGNDPIGPANVAREAIRAALAGVPGLSAHSAAPDNPVEFDAFPRWALTNYTGGKLRAAAVHEYDALVILPAGYEPDTVAQGDSLLDLVAGAVRAVGEVRTADPIQLTFGVNQTPMPALRVRVIPRFQ
jgi:hypothetical protein